MERYSDKKDKFERFGHKLAKKLVLGTKLQKFKSGFRTSILEIVCGPIFRKNRQVSIFGPKFDLKAILGLEFQQSKISSIGPKIDFRVGLSKM